MDYGKYRCSSGVNSCRRKSSIDSIHKSEENCHNERRYQRRQLPNLVEKFGITCQLVEYGPDDIFIAISSRQVDRRCQLSLRGSTTQIKRKIFGVIFNPFDIFLPQPGQTQDNRNPG
jgi:hypothetical protein